MNELLEKINYQLTKFQNANAIKKKMIEGDVRTKLRGLAYNISTLDRVIDSVFLQKYVESV
jgi:hypothetical protein